jgi:hypothetical protein
MRANPLKRVTTSSLPASAAPVAEFCPNNRIEKEHTLLASPAELRSGPPVLYTHVQYIQAPWEKIFKDSGTFGTARGSKSKQESAASSTSKPLDEITLFLDRCLGTNIVRRALVAGGALVEIQ